jgi:hypothetical protein
VYRLANPFLIIFQEEKILKYTSREDLDEIDIRVLARNQEKEVSL